MSSVGRVTWQTMIFKTQRSITFLMLFVLLPHADRAMLKNAFNHGGADADAGPFESCSSRKLFGS